MNRAEFLEQAKSYFSAEAIPFFTNWIMEDYSEDQLFIIRKEVVPAGSSTLPLDMREVTYFETPQGDLLATIIGNVVEEHPLRKFYVEQPFENPE